MTLVIIAAGLGSRFGGVGKKQVEPITEHGEFIIDFTVYDAIQAGFDRVVFVIKEENLDIFKSTVGTRIEPHIKVEYAYQRMDDLPAGYKCPENRVKPWGTGHALLAARHIVKENFAAMNADDFYSRDALYRLAEHLKNAKSQNGVADCCMIGYVLNNTLTENGGVSRGECVVGKDGMLVSITERKGIVRGNRTALYEENGKLFPIALDSTVSMNCFGFTPDSFGYLETEFVEYMREHGDSLTDEFYYPSAVVGMMKKNKATVKVYNTDGSWQGVTYHDDKPRVVAAIKKLTKKGIYPDNLWKI